MANRFPLVADTNGIKELPAGDNLDLTGSGIVNAGTIAATAISLEGVSVSADANEINKLDGVTSTTAELNYLDVATLGLSAASKALTADATGVTPLGGGVNETVTALGSGATVNIDLQDGSFFTHALSENVTYTFSNPAGSGYGSSFVLKITQNASAKTITWPATVDWAAATAPTISTGSGNVDVFVFVIVDSTNYLGFTAGQVLS